jgi:hypothetical protein
MPFVRGQRYLSNWRVQRNVFSLSWYGHTPVTQTVIASFRQGVLQMNIFEKMARRITRISWNKTVHYIMLEAEKRRIINSYQLHEILGAWNNECFPERGHVSFLKTVNYRTRLTATDGESAGDGNDSGGR